jgi:hypothetical protein
VATPFDAVDFQSWLAGSTESARVAVPLVLDAVEPGAVAWSTAGRPFQGAGHGVPTPGLGAGQGLVVIPVDNQLAAYAQRTAVVKQLVMGPQAMEGDLKVVPGTALRVGYALSIPGKHPATYVSFLKPNVIFKYTCTKGTNAGSFAAPMPDATRILSDTNSPAWVPSGNHSAPSSYQGSIVVPDVCPAGSSVRLKMGGTFSAGVTSTGTQKISVKWHYSANNSPGNWSSTAVVAPG